MKSHRTIVIELAPQEPPCFPTRQMWLDFLLAAVDAQRAGKGGPLDLKTATPAFNWRFDYCLSCQGRYALSMQTLGKCKPDFLKDLSPAKPAEVTR